MGHVAAPPLRCASRPLSKVALGAVACLALVAPSASAAAKQTAVNGTSVVDSIGVNVHMSYGNTPYRQTDAVRERLRALGVRHVRDGLRADNPRQWAALQTLARAGIRSTLIMSGPKLTASPAEELGVLRGRLLGSVEAVEGINEPDRSGDREWYRKVQSHQRALKAGISGNRRTSWLPVFGPSLTSFDSYDELGSLASFLDFGNLHPYPGGGEPGNDAFITAHLNKLRSMAGDRPAVVTETGYHNATGRLPRRRPLLPIGPQPEPPRGHPPVSEGAAATYVPRLFLEHRRRGIARSYLYELIDEFRDTARVDAEANFGLLRRDLSPKPAFHSLKNLISLVQDPCPPTARRRLGYSVSGGPRVHHLLIGKRDGSLLLALWQPATVYDIDTRRDIEVSPLRVQVGLGETVRSMELYRPLLGSGPVARYGAGSSVSLDVPADVVLVRLRPGKGGFSKTKGRRAPLEAEPQPRLARAARRASARLRAMGARRLIRRRGFRVAVPAGVPGRVTAQLRVRRRGRSVLIASRSKTSGNRPTELRLRLKRRGVRLLRRRRSRASLTLRYADGGPKACPSRTSFKLKGGKRSRGRRGAR